MEEIVKPFQWMEPPEESTSIESTKGIIVPKDLMMRNNSGFTLLEVLLVVLLLAITIVPMLQAFSPAVSSADSIKETAVFTNQARGTMNRVMAFDFDTLNSNQGDPVDLVSLFGSAAEAAKEDFQFRGENYTPTVVIADASGGPGGLLQITVTADYVRLTTLKAAY